MWVNKFFTYKLKLETSFNFNYDNLEIFNNMIGLV